MPEQHIELWDDQCNESGLDRGTLPGNNIVLEWFMWGLEVMICGNELSQLHCMGPRWRANSDKYTVLTITVKGRLPRN